MSLETLATQAAREAGILLAQMQDAINPREKAAKDLVTEADVASQEDPGDPCRRTPHRLLSWRRRFDRRDRSAGQDRIVSASTDLSQLEYCWVIDPLDGTANYVHKLQTYSVSIALLHYGDPVVATVYDPVMDAMYGNYSRQGSSNQRSAHCS